MGRKKKKQSKPWCWYCNREFDDEKILIQHQKAKHFKCHICHKKLYTGPGLSIHCMQVHKEAIDKVPNSMPTRSNIEIEIYGMEGIPPEDLKEHEKQKQGKHGRPGSPSSGEDEPLPKKKSEGLMGPQPGMPQNMVNPGFPSISPMMGPMGPIPPFMPPGIGMMGSGTPVPSAIPAPHLQNKPLFPSAAAIASTTNQTSSNDTKTTTTAAIGPVKPTFPAYSSSSSSQSANSSTISSEPSKVNLISAVGGSSKIIHPPEDISLEEYLAKLPKYQGSLPATPPVEDTPSSSSPPPTTTAPTTVTSQQPPEERRVPVSRMPVGVSGGILPPVSSVAIMAGACPPLIRAAPPTIPLIPASMPIIRHPQMQLHPGISYQGLIGGVVPPQVAYGGGPPMFPAGPPAVLTPMMPPRFR
ncbi:BUB3-interacting and GLEBS motif-containing protein ZNF207 isoform X1 [Halyomorpha halys]|uniref:BUB3-interacting and GLEBS motif-containing protein ZNF207 isoform X1 n=1 Tax=Halyomorpha halys TaxID=286706 RepID=UPI0006D519EC|nr:BUB3-interacting and GLEBS motif-containing protein ZNF207 isoform X1 [Halyomorpha halys]